MNHFKKLLIVLVLLISVISFIGCKEKGPAEKAGEKLDKAMQDVSKKADDFLGK